MGEGVEVDAFGKVLTKQTIGIFVASALPGAMRVTKEDVHIGINCKLNVFGHLFALVPGQGAAQLRISGHREREDRTVVNGQIGHRERVDRTVVNG